jgi:hypothetical protein
LDGQGVIPDDPALSDLGRSFPNGAGVTKVNPTEELDVGGSGRRVDMDAVVAGVNGNGSGNGHGNIKQDEDEDDDEEVEELPEPEKEEQDQTHGDMYLDTVSLHPGLHQFDTGAQCLLTNFSVHALPGRPSKPRIRFRAPLLQIFVESKRLLLSDLRQVFPRSR